MSIGNTTVTKIISSALAASLLSACSLFEIPDSSSSGKKQNEELTLEQIAAIAIEIPQAIDYIGEKEVWVHGYIAGGDLTSKSLRIQGPFTSATNIAITPRRWQIPDNDTPDGSASDNDTSGDISTDKSGSTNVTDPEIIAAIRAEAMSVSLPQGAVRNGLNLVTNPDLTGAEVYLRGEIVVAYFGLTGIKPATDYRIAEPALQ